MKEKRMFNWWKKKQEQQQEESDTPIDPLFGTGLYSILSLGSGLCGTQRSRKLLTYV